ncbi:MAG TPA: glycosyltransferase, partial [Bryobacteraceae bacterium]|nr:glycosyltransferase [Bryobacteraceae bacterium]
RVGRFREWDSTLPHTLNILDWMRSRNRYEWIWGHYLNPAGFVAAFFGKQNRIASIVSIRGNDLDREMFPPGDFARLEWTLRNASMVTSVTRALAAKAQAISGRCDIALLHNVVDANVFRPLDEDLTSLRRELGIEDAEVVLGFSGELREKKGLRALLEALQHVQAKRPACLLVIGEVRPSEMPRLLTLLGADTLLEHRIIVTGMFPQPEDVNRHLQLCDVYLQPSLWDGMPNALLEAMAAARGCIVSDAGGIPEVLTPGVEGILLPRWQLHRLGEAVLAWLDSDAATKQQMGKAARERMVSFFHEDAERQALQALLERISSS